MQTRREVAAREVADASSGLADSFARLQQLQIESRETLTASRRAQARDDMEVAVADHDAAIQNFAAKSEALQQIEIELAEEARRSSQDDAAYWFRRFMTSLGIGHGAAFAAVLAGVGQSDNLRDAAAFAFWPSVLFGVGLLLAGLIPLGVFLQRWSEGRPGRGWFSKFTDEATSLMTIGSSLLFATGVVVTIVVLYVTARQPTATQRPESGSEAVSPERSAVASGAVPMDRAAAPRADAD